ncbi:MAG: HNH endonuclease, partial [Burkholderiales bacterium]
MHIGNGGSSPQNHTCHHLLDKYKMVLVDYEVHRKFGHNGGFCFGRLCLRRNPINPHGNQSHRRPRSHHGCGIRPLAGALCRQRIRRQRGRRSP